MLEYADLDKNGHITMAEKDAFYINLMKGRNVKLVSESALIDADGENVSVETLIKWINEYRKQQQGRKNEN